LFWTGRLDETEALCRLLGAPLATADAELVGLLLERLGGAGLVHLFGRWALAWIDASGGCFLARAPIAGRSLFWTQVPGGVLVATDWEPLFADPRWDHSLDPHTLAAFFSVHLMPDEGRSFYQGLRLVPPGARVQLAPVVGQPERFWQPAVAAVWQGTEAEAETVYRGLLERAVLAAVADAQAPALLLSSGLDSSSIAAIAVKKAVPLRALSWSILSVPAVDESRWVGEFVSDLGMQWELIPVDGIWPLHQVSEYLPPIFGPLSPPLRGLRQPLYQRAAELGADVVLTGDGGDLLFLGAEDWLRGLLLGRQWSAVQRGLRAQWRSGKAGRRLMVDLVKSLLPQGARGWRQGQVLPWLTTEAQASLAGCFDALRSRGGERRLRALRSTWADLHEAALAPGFQRMGLEVRHPFRERRLAEFFLSLPPHLLFQPGESKRLARRAMLGVLPENTRTAPRRGELLPVARRFLTDSLPLVRGILEGPDRDWPRWVRQDWMEATLQHLPDSGRDGAAWLVVWNCVAYELWKRRWTPPARLCQTNSIPA
jgi:asparagine synthase (glutamine-hydrolysing)